MVEPFATETFPPLVDRAIVLTGPTASGKSAVGVELAQRMDGEILSLDSIAVYRGMDIGTAKPTAAERASVPHHLIDVAEPNEDFSVACYLERAHQLIAEIADRGRQPIFVGGTPMFLKAVLRGFDPGPPPDWEFRRMVEADVRRHGADALRQRLNQVDPLSAQRIAPGDTRRMIRALEVAKHTGMPLSHRQVQFERSRRAEACHVYGLRWPRARLHQRINERVARMFDAGLVDEIRGLLDRYDTLSRTARQAVGYRETIAWFQDGGALSELIESVSAHTRQLARRQETWFRSFTEMTAVEIDDPLDPAAVADDLVRRIRRSAS